MTNSNVTSVHGNHLARTKLRQDTDAFVRGREGVTGTWQLNATLMWVRCVPPAMKIERRMTRPLSEVLRNVATAVAKSQTELDSNALAVGREIERAVEAGELDHAIDAPWYKFSEVGIDLDLELEMTGEPEVDDQGEVRALRPVAMARPTSGGSRHRTEYEAELGAEVSATLVAVPPEKSTDER